MPVLVLSAIWTLISEDALSARLVGAAVTLELPTLTPLTDAGVKVTVALPPHALVIVTPPATALKVTESGLLDVSLKLTVPAPLVVPDCGMAGFTATPAPFSCTGKPLIGALVVSLTVTVTFVGVLLLSGTLFGAALTQELAALTVGVAETTVGSPAPLLALSLALFGSPEAAGLICALFVTLPAMTALTVIVKLVLAPAARVVTVLHVPVFGILEQPALAELKVMFGAGRASTTWIAPV